MTSQYSVNNFHDIKLLLSLDISNDHHYEITMMSSSIIVMVAITLFNLFHLKRSMFTSLVISVTQ